MMKQWELLEQAITVGKSDRLLLWGPPSVGKSYMARHYYPNAIECTLFEDLSAQELLGHYIPQGNVFVWSDGPITHAMREGLPLIINELGRASGSVLDAMLAVLDKPALLTLPNRDTVRAKPGYSVIATSNSAPDMLDAALQSRFDAAINVTAPSPQCVTALNQCYPGLGHAVEDSYAGNSVVAPRQAFAWLNFQTSGMPSDVAAQLVFGEFSSDFLTALAARGGK